MYMSSEENKKKDTKEKERVEIVQPGPERKAPIDWLKTFRHAYKYK